MSREFSDQDDLALFKKIAQFTAKFGGGRDAFLARIRHEHAKPGGLGRLGIVIGSDVQYCTACGANIAGDDGRCSNIHCWLGRETEPLQRAMIKRVWR